MFVVRRNPGNPLLAPVASDAWQSLAAFNPSVVVDTSGLQRMYYRALAHPTVVIAPFGPGSSIGMATSSDGEVFSNQQQVLAPREHWEAFGCEDPRATVIDGTTYLTYTALGGFPFGPENIKAAIAVSKDGITFDERHLVTPFNAKAFTLFPQKVAGKYAALLTAHTDWTAEHPRPVMGLALADTIEEFWSPEFWNEWHANLDQNALPNLRRVEGDHIETGAAPLYTEQGWLLIYSYIQNYYHEESRVFGIEAILLDLDDPKKIIGRTYPFLVPEESYEKDGMVPNIVFPSSAVVDGELLDIYYGGADTVCARASVRFQDLMEALTKGGAAEFVRAPENPIISPISTNEFESRLTFNPAAIDLDGSVHILYRAMSAVNTSTIGYARSKDGVHIDERLPVAIYGPRADFELKIGGPLGNSGCEDARAVVMEGRVYITYTAYDGAHPPQCAIASISVDDFLTHCFDRWSEPLLMTPDGIDDKDVSLLPERLNGKYVVYHRIHGRICADVVEDLLFKERVTGLIDILGPRTGMWDHAKVGISSPPIKVEGGWIMFYHGVSALSRYTIGAALLDESGLKVLSRTSDPIFEPGAKYEIDGEVPNVVFPCGAIVRDDTVFLYYGGGDTVVGVATASLSKILSTLI
ncbi:MAG: hypothetical protein ABIT47_04435 [Candidatus Paceibacterota bacterium]